MADLSFIAFVLGLICKFMWSLITNEPLIKKTINDALYWTITFLFFAVAYLASRYSEDLVALYFGPVLWSLVIILGLRFFIDWESIFRKKYPTTPTPPGQNQMTIKEKQLQEQERQTETMEELKDIIKEDREKYEKKIDKLGKDIDDLKSILDRKNG